MRRIVPILLRVSRSEDLLLVSFLMVAAGVVVTTPPQTHASSHSTALRASQSDACRAPEETASYRVAFTSTWGATTHPDGFPGDAHFSDLIGATHSSRWAMWVVGGLASPGIERMAERGKSAPLTSEIDAAIRAGHAGTVLVGGNIKRSPGSVSLEFRIARAFPLVSLVAMLAPSPDWFIGVAGLDLCENQHWANERTVVLYAYDAGTDSGMSYHAPDADTQPRERIRRIEWPPFRVEGEIHPVGMFRFTRR